ncbi:MAG: rod shape-determining protein MreC [Candidatus Omnitrophota bacterium]
MHTSKNNILKFALIAVLLVLLIANSKNIISPARIKVTDAVSRPLKYSHGFFSAFKRIVPFACLREENGILRDKISLLSRKLEEAKMVYDENERLKSFINFRKAVPHTTIPAQVIGRDPANWSNSIIIDKGLSNGIRQDRAVLSVKGLVGRVVEAGRRSSRILLITDPNSKVGVLIQKNRQGGILVGRPDGMCKMIYIALDSDVAKGDKIITAGFGPIFPKDILVGEVTGISKEPGRLYKTAIVRTTDDLSKLEEVLCIK